MSTEREAFESWAGEYWEIQYFRRGPDESARQGEYLDHGLFDAWQAWQSRAALAQPSVPLTEARAFEIWERAAQIDLSGRVNELIRIKDAQCVIRSILMAAQEKP